MKKYFFLMILTMVGFTGYILINRPGNALKVELPFGESVSLSSQTSKNLTPPFFIYISGDVLIKSNKGETYSAQNKVSLEENDEIFVNFRSRAILKLGKEQFILLKEGTKIVLTNKLKRERGLIEFFFKRGLILVDFFQGKKPIGIKIKNSYGYTFSQDTTFRMESNKDSIFIANDRNPLLLIHNNGAIEETISQGKGGIFTQDSIETGNYPWVDDFPWEQEINALSLRGYGRKGVMDAPKLSTRIPTIKKTQEVASRQRVKRRARPQKKEQESSSLGTIINTIKDKAQNLGGVGNKIKESAQAIDDFKKKQRENQKRLDSI